jgi:hypothetical protein
MCYDNNKEIAVTIQESIKNEIDTLPVDSLYAVQEFLLFQRHRSI